MRYQDKTYGFMGIGDTIGYMNWLSIPKCEHHPFDIIGEKEGYIAILSLDYLSTINKRDPHLVYRLTDLCSRLTLRTVDRQSQIKGPNDILVLHHQEFKRKTKKQEAIKDSLGFGDFLSEIDSKSKKAIIGICDIISFKFEEKVININSPLDSIFIISKGSLHHIDENGPGKIVPSGEILGVREFLFGLSWEGGYIGSKSGELIRMNIDSFLDLLDSNPRAGTLLLNFLVRTVCNRIRAEYKHEFKKNDHDSIEDLMGGSLIADSEDEEKTPSNDEAIDVETLDFLEIDIRKKNIVDLEDNDRKDSNLLKPFRREMGEPPLFSHKVFSSWMTPEQVQIEDVEMVNMENKKGPGIFLKSKVSTQTEQFKQKRTDLRKQRKEGIKPEIKKPITNKFLKMDAKDRENCEALEIEHETLKNEYNLLDLDYTELQEKAGEASRHLKELEEQLRQLKAHNVSLTAQRNLYLVHEELKNKDLESDEKIISRILAGRNRGIHPLNHVLKEQLKLERKEELIRRCIKQWRSLVKGSVNK